TAERTTLAPAAWKTVSNTAAEHPSRLPGGKVDVLAGRDCGQRREPAQVGAADVKPAELDALDQGVPSLRPQRQHTEAVLQGGEVFKVVPFRLGAEQPDQPA